MILSPKNYWTQHFFHFPRYWHGGRLVHQFSWIEELYSTKFRGLVGDPPFGMKMTAVMENRNISGPPNISGAANGSVPENTCSSGKFLLAGRCGKKLFVLGMLLLLGKR